MTHRPRSNSIGVRMPRRHQRRSNNRARSAVGAGLIAATLTLLIGALGSAMFPPALAAQENSLADAFRVTTIDASDPAAVELTLTLPRELIDSGVDPSSVTVVEDGVRRDATVRAITGPVQLGLVIDTSASMYGDPLVAAAQAARACLDGLPLGSMAFLIAYSDQPTVAHQMSSDLTSVGQGLDRLVAVGETATHDALIAASAQFSSGQTGLDRFVVLLSDGSDNISQTTLRQATDRLITDDAAVYALALETGETDINTLQQIAAATNGALITTTAKDLVAHCTTIGRQVSNRYAVTYSSENTKGGTGGSGSTRIDVSLSSNGGAGATTSTMVDFDTGSGGPSDPIEAFADGEGGGQWTPIGEATGDSVGGALEIPLGADTPGLGAGPNPPEELPMGNPVDGARASVNSGRALWVGAGAMFAAMSTMFAIVLVPSQSAVTAKRLTLKVDIPKDTSGKRFGALNTIGDQFSSLIDSVLARGGIGSGLNASLDAAGINLRPGEYVAIFVGGAVGLFLFLAAAGFGGMAPLAFVCVPALGYLYLKRRSKQRLGAFQDQLVETLMIMAGSIRAGHGMMQSISSVADQAEDPTAAEFGRVITEVRIGRDPIDSLHAMAERVGSIDLTWTVRAMALNRELGGNLAEILDNVSDTIRERNRIADQVRALSAEGKFSAYVLFGLPFGVVFAVRILNAEYIEPLFNTSAGHKIIGVALGLMTVGAIWIKKMIKIEY